MTIYLVAGPPGIGKSTHSQSFIPAGIPIVDQDLAAYQYKKVGFANYQDIASLTSNQRIRDFLFNRESFALELNLGFESHYDYLRSIAAFDYKNQIDLILFFSDDINVCLDRAKIRHLNGGHEVTAEVIREMYAATMPLFELNKILFSRIILVDVTYDAVIELTKDCMPLPAWVLSNNLGQYLLAR
jgi:predicted ABC-type ATPase